MKELRLFIALDIPMDVCRMVAGDLETMRSRLDGPYRWVQPERMHITLRFLGRVTKHRVPVLAAALERAVSGYGPITLEFARQAKLAGAGALPRRGSPRVLWLPVGGDLERLAVLRSGIADAMSAQGFGPPEREFQPHVTLARVGHRLDREEWDRLQSALMQVNFAGVGFTAEAVGLVRSEPGAHGSEYCTLHEFQLGRQRVRRDFAPKFDTN